MTSRIPDSTQGKAQTPESEEQGSNKGLWVEWHSAPGAERKLILGHPFAAAVEPISGMFLHKPRLNSR